MQVQQVHQRGCTRTRAAAYEQIPFTIFGFHTEALTGILSSMSSFSSMVLKPTLNPPSLFEHLLRSNHLLIKYIRVHVVLIKLDQ